MADPEDVPGLQALVAELRAQIAQLEKILFPPGSGGKSKGAP